MAGLKSPKARAAEATPLSLRALNRATLARQLLLERVTSSPVAVVEQLAGLQAQWPKPPYIGLWTRIANFQREDLSRLLHAHELVRATMMRGTLHLVSAQDYLRFRSVMQPMLTRGMESILKDRAQGLDLAALLAAATSLLEHEPHTFEDIRDYLLSLNPDADERAMGYSVRMSLPLIMAPNDGPWGFPTNACFALAERWLGQAPRTGSDPHELVMRYFAAFGPASVVDAQTWSGLKGLRIVVDELRPQLETFRDERGRELFDLPNAARPVEDTPAPVRFLPEFDNLLLGHEDRTRIIADQHRPWVYLSALRVAPTFLVDGFVAGTWKTARTKKTATLTIETFDQLTQDVRADLTEEGNRLLRFVEPDAEGFDITVSKAAPAG